MSNNNRDTITIKLVSTPDNKRSLMFKSLLEKVPEMYSVSNRRPSTTTNKEKDIHIFFDTSGFTSPTELVDQFSTAQNTSFCIYDISDECDLTNSAVLIALTCADFLLCESDITQEKIYETVGRLAAIVSSYDESLNYSKPKFHTKTIYKEDPIWCGTLPEYLPLRTLLEDKKVTSYVLGDYTKIGCKLLRAGDKGMKQLLQHSIWFFPPQPSQELEHLRIKMVEMGIRNGRIVIAPDLHLDYKNLHCFQTLEEVRGLSIEEILQHVENSQRNLKETETLGTSLDQLVTALIKAPEASLEELQLASNRNEQRENNQHV